MNLSVSKVILMLSKLDNSKLHYSNEGSLHVISYNKHNYRFEDSYNKLFINNCAFYITEFDMKILREKVKSLIEYKRNNILKEQYNILNHGN